MANIPQPIVAGGGPRQRSLIEQILASILAQTPSLAIALLNQRSRSQEAAAKDVGERGALQGAMQGPLAQDLIPMIYGAGGAGQPAGGLSAPAQPDVSKLPRGAAGTILTRGLEVGRQAQERRTQDASIAAEKAKQDTLAAARDAARKNYAKLVKGDEAALALFDFAEQALVAGFPAPVIESTLPPAASELRGAVRDLGAHLTIVQTESTMDADKIATGWFKRSGVIPANDPVQVIPGAAKAFLAMRETAIRQEGERKEKPINWMQRGLDFITGRIGETGAGTGSWMPESNIPPITVDQALGEWSNFVQGYAPPEIATRELARIRSGTFQRMLERALATREAAKTLAIDPAAEATVREVLRRNRYSEEEINTIIKDARSRNTAKGATERLRP